MLVNVAQGVPATKITSDARIYAERIYALLIARALAIRVTFRSKAWKRWSDRSSYAFYVSVARKVLRTEADTGMRCGFTLRVESALGCQTGVYASSVQTLLMVGAILIQMTLYIAQINRLALAVNVGDGIRWTQADHRTKRYRVQNFAFLFTGTHTGGHTRVLTPGVNASEIQCAFAVLCAFRLDGRFTNACYIRISGSTRRTCTSGLMIACDADRRLGTGIVVANRSANPVQSIAGLVIGAVFVVMTDCGNARHTWITLSTLRANALGSVRDRSAFRTPTAHDITNEARSDAVVISTGLVIRTIVVRLTFRSKALKLRITG